MKLLIGLCALCVAVLAQDPVDVENAIRQARAQNELNRELNRERNENAGGDGCARRCPMANFHGRRPSDRVTADNTANDLLAARRLLQEDGFTAEALQEPEVVEAFQLAASTNCEPEIVCDNSVNYRTADGTCNNLASPRQGSAGAAQIRLMDPVYDDGFSSPRTRSVVPGGVLPSAREVSNEVHRAGPGAARRSSKINLHVFQMGQFLDHDIISTPVQGEVSDCCTAIGDVDNCFPIRIDWENDPNPNFVNGYCMNFARSSPHVCPQTSTIIRREQVNVITSFVDASNVYGSSAEEQADLRADGTGLMKVTDPDNYGIRLPDSDDNDACVSNVERGIFCSLAGDHRVNVVPSLAAYHNLFVLEHNRIATQLSAVYTDPEQLFQETRRLVIAIMQKVIYDEFLPSFVSSSTMEKFRLLSSAQYRYSANIDPTISNAFGIAYRMGHTWIPRTMDLFDSNFNRFRGGPTEQTYFDPELTYVEGRTPGMDGLALWLTGENSTATDRIIENAARDSLFLDEAGNSFDLVALNIQRGRDHGLPSYTAFRTFCELDKEEVREFSALQDIAQGDIGRLSRVYRDPRDIDLFTGALTETLVDGESLGPTLSCILGDQFSRLKFGDRFWYQGEAANFNEDQIKAIRDYSMAKLLCNNYVFRTVNAPNAFVATDEFSACGDIAQLNLVPFGVTAPSPTTSAPRTNPPPPNGGDRPPPPPNGGDRPPPPPPRREFSKKAKQQQQSHLDELLEDLLERLENN